MGGSQTELSDQEPVNSGLRELGAALTDAPVRQSRFLPFNIRPLAACAVVTCLAASAVLTTMPNADAAAPSSAPEVYQAIAANTEVTDPQLTLASRALANPASRFGERLELDPETAIVPALVVAGESASARLEVETVTEPFETVEQHDPNRFSDLPPLVIQQGQVGEVTRIFRYVDDSQGTAGEAVLEISVSERLDHIVAIGTRTRPAALPFTGEMVDGGIDESIWVALAQCESGGRADVISPGGRFHGLYQFSVATWNSVGGTGLPSQASPEEQRYRAVALQARSGWGQWPACSRRLGLR